MGQWGHDKTHPAGGAQPGDLQQIFAAQWVNSDKNPLIGGGKVTGRTDLRYNVSDGVALIKTANGVSYRTWGSGTTKLLGQPSVTRTDVVVVDNTGQIDVLDEGSFDESQYGILARMVLPAGATATNAATLKHDPVFAMPHGAAHGWVAGYGEIRSGAVPSPERMWQGSFYNDTDRKMDFHVDQAIFGNVVGAYPTITADARSLGQGYCRYAWFLDNQLVETFELPYDRGYVVEPWVKPNYAVSVGLHTYRVERISTWGAPAHFFGGGTEKLSMGFVGIRDTGISE